MAVLSRTTRLWLMMALMACAAGVAICYFFVDRPVAWLIHDHVPRAHWVKRATEILPIVARLALPALVVGVAGWLRWPTARAPRIFLALALSVIVTAFAKEELKWVFGRYWPETWTQPQQNPSLIRDNAYGFHPFTKGVAYQSFPSGHTAVAFCLAGVVWVVWPRWPWRATATTLALAIAAAMVGLNYHFVSDVLAGGFLGAMIGALVALAIVPEPSAVPALQSRTTCQDASGTPT